MAEPSTIHSVSAKESAQQTPPAPWEISSVELERYIRTHLHLDGLIVAALDLKNPQPDEVMAVVGDVLPETVPTMLRQWPLSDQTFEMAVTSGVAQTEISHSACRGLWPNADAAASVLYVVLTNEFGAGSSWFIAACRRQGSFSANEINLLRQLLNQWAERFSAPSETNMLRLLVGHDLRTILIDSAGEQQLITDDIDRRELIQHIQIVENQRWVEPEHDRTHDLTLSINGTLQWVRLHHRNPLGVADGEQTYLELRQLAVGEMTAANEITDHRVARALALIHERYSQSLTLEEISAAVGISLFHFHRLFSQHVGVTPKQYLLQKQIQVARWLLRTRRTPIGRIAELTGFASHGHFTSTFSRMVGMNPSTYRDQASPSS